LIFQPGINVVKDAWGVSVVLVLLILILFSIARFIGSMKPGRHRLRRHRRPATR